MRRALLLPLLALLVAPACVVAVPPASVMIPQPAAYYHGPYDRRFWGWYGQQPVYYDDGHYVWWDGEGWVRVARPPVVVYRQKVHYYSPRANVYWRTTAPAPEGPPFPMPEPPEEPRPGP